MLIDLQTGAGDITALAELLADLAARHTALQSTLALYPANAQVAPESVVEAVHEAVNAMLAAVPRVPTPFAVEVEARWSDQAQRAKAGVQVVPLHRSDVEQAVVQGWREWQDALTPVDAQVKALQRQAGDVAGADVDVALNLLAAVDSTVGEQIPPLVGKAKAMRQLAALADEQRNTERAVAR